MKRGRKPKEEVKTSISGIAILVECTPQTREKEAEAAFVKRMDNQGGVTAVNEACGGSVRFANLESFPGVNMRCTCGNPMHYMVKYKFI
jgi:hypothetical protein